MKKTGLIALFALFVTVIMIGCGSNSKSDPLPPPASTGPYMLTNVTSPFDIGYAGQQQDFQVQLLKDGYPVSGETVSVGYLPANFGFVSNVTAETDAGGYATFKYIAADPLTNGVQSLEIYHEFIPDSEDGSEGGSEDGLETFISVAYLAINVQNGPTPTSPYTLTNVTSPFDIGYASQEQDFQVQLLKDGYPAVGETVSVGYLPANFGFVSNATAETDAGGYATFKYIAADSLTDGVQSLEIYHEFIPDSEGGSEDDLETFISVAYLSINVQNGSTPFDYKFINATSQIIINNSGDQEQISIELVDINNEPVAGKTVTITAPETGYGSVDPRSSITNAVGGANFTYTAPNDVRGLSSTTLTVNFSELGNEINQDIQILFQSAGYRLENPSTPIMINAPQQAEEISVYLMDENNEPVSGKIVSIAPLDAKYGSIDPLQTLTQIEFPNTGKATFNYTGPDDIRGLGSTTTALSFTDEFGVTITQNVVIQFENTSNYQLVNAKDPYYVYAPDQVDTFDIQLINNGLPVLSPRACVTDTTNVTTDCVMPYAIDRRFGRFQGIDGSTGQGDGYIYYNYLAPSDEEKAVNGEDTTFIVIYIDALGVVVAESDPITLRMRY